MPVDTRNKRSSALHVTGPWRCQWPTPDGTIAAGDRQEIAFMYSGIAADPPAPVVGSALDQFPFIANMGTLMRRCGGSN